MCFLLPLRIINYQSEMNKLTIFRRLLCCGMACCALALAGCDTVFDVHPYDVHIRGEKGMNAKNIALIENATLDKDTIRLAFISDSHKYYNGLQDIIKDINRRDSIDFVVHCGDMASSDKSLQARMSATLCCWPTTSTSLPARQSRSAPLAFTATTSWWVSSIP